MLSYEEICMLIDKIFWLIIKYKIVMIILSGIALFPKNFLESVKRGLAENKRIREEIKEAQKELDKRSNQQIISRSNYKSTSIGFMTTTITDKKES